MGTRVVVNDSMNVFLDFDIGGDVDDMMCLAFLLACDEFDLKGISTVLWNVWERAEEALTFLQAAGHCHVPVACGCSSTMAPNFRHPDRIGYDQWARGFKLCEQAQIAGFEDSADRPLPIHGVDFLIDRCMREHEQVIPVLTAVLTDMAMALVKEPRLCDVVPQLAIMAGEFESDHIEQNIRCDVTAADIVFRSNLKATVIPFKVGVDCRLCEEEVRAIGESEKPSLKLLYRAIRGWQEYCREDSALAGPCLFDPCVPIALLRPEFFQWKQGRVLVDTGAGDSCGRTRFEEDALGPHRLAVSVDRDLVVGFFMERILGNA
ncbi:nucleoside hydrolase [Tichowtungia aerotolerans]|uniref:Inosine/uridine-preferring nucleoside hydrolase domain-containing protein n=1 Tax=Tichowtungia aerotolerans TaxID=2697043 RepID=A0A6P1MCI3_9BACT|nr:nucleoside hydrolase [Tichowtungia aerotolerans]QHI69778.1 hypothetical protein GT409_10065 [Tichowtungia aerotolerans]